MGRASSFLPERPFQFKLDINRLSLLKVSFIIAAVTSSEWKMQIILSVIFTLNIGRIQPVTKYRMPVKCILLSMYEYNITKLQGFSRLL